MKAIAAMSLNRVIGLENKIPWHLPEDFKWFKRTTLGQTVVMGRKTFLSLGKPLPGRKNYVLTRHPQALLADPAVAPLLVGATSRGSLEFVLPGVAGTELIVAQNLDAPQCAEAWLAGGTTLYAQFLPACSDLYLSVVFREVAGDAFFPPFEEFFGDEYSVEFKTAEFEVRHYRRLSQTSV